MPSTIFVIDSSPAVRRMVEQISTPEGFEVIGFHDGPAALEAARKMSPALIIADYHLDNMTFSGFCKEVHKLDNLSETFIISLVSPADRFDEEHLRSLGVKAFLKKPFQSDNLLDVIKNLDTHQQTGSNGTKKRRSWPPVSSETDAEEGATLSDPLDDIESSEEEVEQTRATRTPPSPTSPQPSTPPASPPSAKVSRTTPVESEDSMKGLFGQLLQTMSERTEEKVSKLLPQIVGKELASQVAKAVQDEVQVQLGASLSQDRLVRAIEPLFARELSNVLKRDMSMLEPIIRHSIVGIASPLVKENIGTLVREQAETVKKALPDVIHEQIGSIDVLVRDEIQQAAVKQAARIAEEIVRAAAIVQIEQAIQRLVPDIAEEQIKAELKRLTTME